ncbi:YjgN family protein [Ferrimonas sp. SCSIO 43195]|uniref:YjgN family protein n=1 Tax=Ferrimonas sp. SCSIO 43195 TaxID=2822844 RepID=UPI0020762814|nr:YjgN family protein [Ferrimonas sp. SCSIO 43195]USD35765.1 DUF898 domain-containing protein [Ferrimonas sp. SCSIO 43195]
MEPNYSAYSLAELLDAQKHLDSVQYPQRAQRLQQEIDLRCQRDQQLAAERDSSAAKRLVRFEFTGQKGAYFKLWIVNLLLSIVTLGIYSAWAKVRNSQYMLGHTKLDGQPFRYLAKPMQILKGRIVAVVVLVLFTLVSQLSPFAGLLMTLGLLVATPWLILQGMRFSMRMTAYKNVRFSFEGSYFGTLVTFVLLPMVGAFTLYLAMPWVFKKMDQYLYGNSSFGGKRFEVTTDTGPYYGASLAAAGLAIVGFIALFSLVGVNEMVTQVGGDAEAQIQLLPILLMYSGAFLVSFLVRSLYQGMIFNHVFEQTQIDNVVSFEPKISVGSYVAMMTTNAAMLLGTLGLAYPVTQVRKMAFITESVGVALHPGAQALTNTVSGDDSAFGEEAAGVFDLDLSIT